MYAKIQNDEILKLGGRPRWLQDDGSPVTDAQLAAQNWYRVVDDPPTYNSTTHSIAEKPQAEWVIDHDAGTVTKKYTKSLRSVADIQKTKNREFDGKLRESLAPIQGQYSEDEIKTWYRQDQESAAYKEWENAGSNGTPPPTPAIDAILAKREFGETKSQFVDTVRLKVDTFAAAIGDVGKVHTKKAAVQAIVDDYNAGNITHSDAATQMDAVTWG